MCRFVGRDVTWKFNGWSQTVLPRLKLVKVIFITFGSYLETNCQAFSGLSEITLSMYLQTSNPYFLTMSVLACISAKPLQQVVIVSSIIGLLQITTANCSV